MSDNVTTIINETIDSIVINPITTSEIVDINVYETTDEIDVVVSETTENVSINVNETVTSVDVIVNETNDFVDVNVYDTPTNVLITVNPTSTLVNINQVLGGSQNLQNLQEVTDIGANTSNSITANSFIKNGGTGTNLLLDNGSIVALSSIGGNTNLSPSQTSTNFTINSDTGTDATIPLGNGTLAGATLNDYTTAEKNKLAGIEVGAEVNVNADWNAISGDAQILNKPTIPSVTNLVPYTGANQNVDLGINTITASSLIKQGGTSAQLLAANGDAITAGTNITISGGTISSTGGAGGSSSVNFYLNGSVSSEVAGYQQIGANAIVGTGTDFSLVGNGTIAQFLTDVGSPNRLEIPSGAWNFELWLQSNVNNSSTNVHIELYKYDGAFTLIATGVSNPISLQTNITTNLYVINIAIPQTTLLVTDRLAIRVIATNSLGLHSITLHTEDSNLCEILTNFVGGVTAINGITQPSQTLVTGTTGTDFAVVSSGSTHTFNLPSASVTARGVITTEAQTIAGDKTFTGTTAGITKSMVGLSNVDNTSDANKPISTSTQTALNLKVDSNTAITGATKTKITYDSKGLVIAGADATTADIADSTNKRYVTDANLIVIDNTSNTNTGDNAVNSLYSGLATSKQDKITLTTSGTSGAATLTGATLNIPQYSGATNLEYNASPTNGTVTSSTGSSAIIPLADGTNAGLFSANEKTKLSGIATGAEVNVNADWNAISGDAQILNKPIISGTNTGDNATNTQYSGLATSKQDTLSGTGFVKSTAGTISYDTNAYTIANTAITGATNTKITYDAKGLVTAGTNANLDDLGDVIITTPTLDQVLKYNGTNWVNGTGGAGGGVTTFSGGTTGLTPSTATSGAVTLAGTLNVLNGGTGSINASGARTNLGASTVGSNVFTVTNPSAITFLRVNANNTVSLLDAASFRTAIGASGTVTSVSVVSANGFTGTVATATSTPAITLTTSITGLLKGNGTAISAATDGTDYLAPNAPITAATNTKITYDAKGLVTNGTSLIASDIPNIEQTQVTGLTSSLSSKENNLGLPVLANYVLTSTTSGVRGWIPLPGSGGGTTDDLEYLLATSFRTLYNY